MTELGHFSAINAVVAIRADEPLATVITTALSDLHTDAQSTHRLDVALGDTGEWSLALEPPAKTAIGRYRGALSDVALADVIAVFNELAAESCAESSIVLHAGCVQIDGVAVALAGHSGAGKSTLTAAFARHGYPVISEEVTATTTDFNAIPFRRPIGLRAAGASAVGVVVPKGPYDTVYPCPISTLGPKGDPAPLKAVFVLDRDKARDRTTGRRRLLLPADALTALSGESLDSGVDRRARFRALERLSRMVPVYRLTYFDTSAAIQAIVDWRDVA
ncbi:MAG: hypothetical protein AAGF73_06805 [Actinomycetota bacterium]